MSRPSSGLLLLVAAGSLFCSPAAFSQTTRPVEGIREKSQRVHALTGAQVMVAPGRVIEGATVILSDGLIEAIEVGLTPPPGARVWDCEGKRLYPGFIDGYGTFASGDVPTPAKPAHWNPLVHPQNKITDHLAINEADLRKRRMSGFVAAHVGPDKGVFRGTTAVIHLGNDTGNGRTLAPEVFHHLSFNLAGYASRTYPRSLMGCIALIRQVLSDARWYDMAHDQFERRPEGLPQPEINAALAALKPVLDGEPVLFECGDELDLDRAGRLLEPFGIRPTLLSSGSAYRQLPLLKELQARLIVPLAFPAVPAVEDGAAGLDYSLARLQHWEQAPSNLARLEETGLSFILTTNRLNNPGDFWKQIRLAVKRGLSKRKALEAITTEPASWLGLDRRLGTIEVGKTASLVLASGDLFTDEKAEIVRVWVEGDVFQDDKSDRPNPTGTWEMQWFGPSGPGKGVIEGRWPNFKWTPEDGEAFPLKADEGGAYVMVLPESLLGREGEEQIRMTARYHDGRFLGSAVLPDGDGFTWSATRVSEEIEEVLEEKEKKEEDGDEKDEPSEEAIPVFDRYPAGAYGVSRKEKKKSSRLLIRKATVWTSSEAGKLEETDLLVSDGKIEALGRDLDAPEGALIVDAEGKHVTPGLIDAHSHTAISRGVNEGSHAVTVEVRIGDVLDPTDINLFRQVAGGLTAANIMHGSANPMGGQNQVIKLRWGSDAEGLKFEGAKPGVKFALGENVKQSNWSSPTNRYPQTRMGVEQVMKDTFIAAREYEREMKDHRSGRSRKPFRRNLRLEAALEILNRERIVHIHSYRQDEILMFVRLAQEFGFEVGTFQHVLEGYKVADAIAEINAGGSSFSDWWAYKFEVYDSIPYNGALMHLAGVVTSFNSDDSELARRMNLEAAKAVKYGGIPEEEALQFVTLNPAKQLRIDHRVGSLEPGKDADLVIWNDHPLSNYARVEQTWIDGRCYYSLEKEAALRERDREERQRLVRKALEERIKSRSLGPGKKTETEESDQDEADDARDDEFKALRMRLAGYFTKWQRYHAIDYQEIYHDGQSLHVCTGDLCEGY
ncbi:MAG: amidohydrolase family protein [Verrucomicrobiota bacterium]